MFIELDYGKWDGKYYINVEDISYVYRRKPFDFEKERKEVVVIKLNNGEMLEHIKDDYETIKMKINSVTRR